MNDPHKDLQDACTELKRRKRAKEVPDRQLVRLAFLALGRIALEGGSEAAGTPAQTLLEAAEEHGERWAEAIDSEMSLAVSEFVQSVDPRYLSIPSYDFHYTVAARERLEARLSALELLGLSPQDGLLERIAEADERLAPHLETPGKGDP